TQFTTGWFQRGVTLLFVLGAARIFFALRPFAPSPNTANAVDIETASPPVAVERPNLGLLAAPLLWLLLYYGTMLTSHVPAFPWYFLPPWPLFLGIAALGGSGLLALVGRFLPAATIPSLRRAWPLALAAFGVFGLTHLRAVRTDIAKTQWQEDSLRVPMGLWF